MHGLRLSSFSSVPSASKADMLTASRKIFCILLLLSAAVLVSAQKNPHFSEGRTTIVHLFEWKFDDIASECERFLGPLGFAGVQVSPVHECLVVNTPYRPWWERYQVISYKIVSRSGNEDEFADMVRRCNAVGVRVYMDVVLNHMTGDHPNAVGIAGTRAEPRERSYPGVPYNASHFNEPCSINDYRNEQEVRNCDLVGLHDLNQSLEYVRGKLVEMLNVLIAHGVAGFRVDAAKHMWPADLKHILDATADLNVSHGFPAHARPFIYQEVIDLGGEGISWNQYTNIGRITEFKFGAELGKAFRGNNALKWLRNFGTDWNLMPSGDAVVFIDNHDNQRGHGAGGNQILTHKDTRLYKMAVAFMLAWPYGEPRLMSSFQFTNSEAGPPHNKKGDILPVTINADMTCGNGWVCEHRWRQIYDMVGFRKAVQGTHVSHWWDNGNNQIAFCRGDKGFIAFNGEHGVDLRKTLHTCLPAGTYCDVISGLKRDGGCTGKAIIVREDSSAHIQIAADEEDGVLAIHINSKL